MATSFLKDTLMKVLTESRTKDPVVLRNLLKEYFQVVVLDFIYAHPVYSQLFFYGGSCLAHCYGLPRLSEDLDFVDMKSEIDLGVLAQDITIFMYKEAGCNIKATRQKFRVHLKIPILRELGLATASESDVLFLKVEIFRDSGLLASSKPEYIPLFIRNRSIIITTFDLPTLMSTKIRAVLLRTWKRTNKKGETVATVKGRDYFDLMWYLERGIKPNLTYLPEAKNLEDLKKQLHSALDRADAKSIRLDLEAFLEDKIYMEKVSHTIKSILSSQIDAL